MAAHALGGDTPPRPGPQGIPPNVLDKRPAPPPREASVLFCEGVQLKLQDKYAEAIERFRQVLALDPEAPAVLYELGFCHYRLGKNKEAAEYLKRSLTLDPRNGPAHETLAFVYNALGERDKALEALEAAAKAPERPRNHESLVQRIAWIYERQRDHKNAIAWYRYLLECGYRDRKTYVSLGALQLKEKLYDEALASFREAVRRSPNGEAATDDVAAAYAQLSEAERADALRRHEAATANTDDPFLLEALAIAYQAAGRDDDMLRTLERSARTASERADAQKHFLAEHFEESGNLPKAIQWRLSIIADRNSPSAEEILRLAELYVKHEEMERAAECYRKALAADPRRRSLLRQVADCHAELYQWDKAAAALEELLKDKTLGPADAEAVFALGEILDHAGKPQEAQARKKQAFDLLIGAISKAGSPAAEARIQITLAQLCYADAKPDKALGYLAVAQQLEPDDPRKLLLLASAYKRVQNWTEAAATLQKYLEKDSATLTAAGALYEMAACLEAAGRTHDADAARQRAKALLLKAAEATPADAAKAAVQMQLGDSELQRNRPKAAIEHFLEALRLNPKQALPHLHLGQCYQMLPDWTRAAAHYKSYLDAARPDERTPRILYRLGVAQARSGQRDLGDQNKRRAIQMLLDELATLDKEQRGTPAHKAQLLRDLAGLYAAQKDHQKALDAAQKALALAPTDKRADYRLTLASIYDDLKRYDDSERILLDTHKADPQNPAVLNHLGYFYAERAKNLDQAIALVKKALHYEPLNGAYLDSLAWAYYQQGNHHEAAKLLARALQYEDDAVIRDHYGDALHKLGKLREAREAWTRALALDPEIEGVAEKLKATEPNNTPNNPKASEKGEKQ